MNVDRSILINISTVLYNHCISTYHLQFDILPDMIGPNESISNQIESNRKFVN